MTRTFLQLILPKIWHLEIAYLLLPDALNAVCLKALLHRRCRALDAHTSSSSSGARSFPLGVGAGLLVRADQRDELLALGLRLMVERANNSRSGRR